MPLQLITTPCLLFLFCLDPCFDGIPWKQKIQIIVFVYFTVLILALMEYLGNIMEQEQVQKILVLILALMEYLGNIREEKEL